MESERELQAGGVDRHRIEDWKSLRRRIEYEDQQLSSRVNILLVTSGLGAAAVGLASDSLARLAISVLALAVTSLLFLCTLQTALMIRRLTSTYISGSPSPVDHCVRSALGWLPRWMRSNFILGVWVPLVLLLGWISGVVMLLVEGIGC
jgi:hypothetical protein